MADLPWFKFYPTDWLGSGTLRRASHAVKGFYIDLLCVMYDCENKGRLEAAGVAWSEEEVSRSVNGDPTENLSHLRWLIQTGVLSKDDSGVIYSRRMVKDESRRKAGSEAGKKGGGNPDLTKDDTDQQTYKGKSKGRPKGEREKPIYLETRDQSIDTRSQKPEPPPPPTPSEAKSQRPEIQEEVEEESLGEVEGNPLRWQGIERRLKSLGMSETGQVVDRCMTQGVTPEFAEQVIDYATAKPSDYWGNLAGAIFQKLTRIIEGEAVDEAWPQPADKYLKREASAKSIQERQETRQREIETQADRTVVQTDRNALEAKFGPVLDGLDSDDREELIAKVCPQESARQQYRKLGKRPGIHRTRMLQFLEHRETADTS